MKRFLAVVPVIASLVSGLAYAQQSAQNQVTAAPVNTVGTLVVIPAIAEVRHANDEATAVFMVEEQDRDKSAAANRVNQKMRQGTEIIKKEDPQAQLKTYGYYTYPVYPEDQQPPRPMPHGASKPRQPTSWRVGQYLEVKTTNISSLPKTVAAAQRILALNGLNFGLTEATSKKLDSKRIEATVQRLNERIVAVARAMGRNTSDALLETIDFEGTGAYAPNGPELKVASMRAAMADQEAGQVQEPSFEPGETVLQMNVVGKVRFK